MEKLAVINLHKLTCAGQIKYVFIYLFIFFVYIITFLSSSIDVL
jgi:hypothetical protein